MKPDWDDFDSVQTFYSERGDRDPLHLYQKLIRLAIKGETTTYGRLGREFGYGHRRWLPWVLGSITQRELENGRPPLSAIVLNAGSGLPSEGLLTVPLVKRDFARYSRVSGDSETRKVLSRKYRRAQVDKVLQFWTKKAKGTAAPPGRSKSSTYVPEIAGDYEWYPPRRVKGRRDHSKVVQALHDALAQIGMTSHNKRVSEDPKRLGIAFPDLLALDSRMNPVAIFEVKTHAKWNSIHELVGQLSIYPIQLGVAISRRIAVLPESTPESVETTLGKLRIPTLRFSLSTTGRVQFSRSPGRLLT